MNWRLWLIVNITFASDAWFEYIEWQQQDKAKVTTMTDNI